MMDWSNLVNLAMGLGVGTVVGWRLGVRHLAKSGKSTNRTQSATPMSASMSASMPATMPATMPARPMSATTADNSQSEFIADLKAEIKQLKLDYYMANRMCQFKAGFLARVTHELRSPLNGLIGAHQLILSDLCDSPEEEREFLANANTSATNMIDMLDRILDVSRTESGNHPIQLKPIPLAEVFEEVRYLTQMQAANRNIALNIVNPDPDIYVLADEQWLTPVVVNLVDSAITPEELGKISVSAYASKESGHAHIWIEAPRSHESWSEAVDLLTKELNRPSKKGGKSESQLPMDLATREPIQLDPKVSSGLNLVMTSTILELMQGRLEILETPADAENDRLTRIQCSLPLVHPPESD